MFCSLWLWCLLWELWLCDTALACKLPPNGV